MSGKEAVIVVNARFLTQPLTGVQRFAFEISLQLKRFLGEYVQFVCPRNIMHKEFAGQLGAKIIGFNKGHIWEQVDLTLFLYRKKSPLLLCLTNTAPVLYTKKVSTIHDLAFLVYPMAFTPAFRLAYRFLLPLIAKSSMKILTVSEFSKQEIIHFYKTTEQKIDVIYNSVNKQFRRLPDNRLSDKRYFLCVSTLNPRKNLTIVLEAFNQLCEKQNKEIELYLIGDRISGSFKDVDFDGIIRNSNVHFLGRIPDEELIRYYSNATAFVYPSFYEGFGLPPLEAQACGCPIIVSNTSALPEIFGDSAAYCNPENPDSLVMQMERMLVDQSWRVHLVNAGFNNVTRFSWEESARKIKKVVDSI